MHFVFTSLCCRRFDYFLEFQYLYLFWPRNVLAELYTSGANRCRTSWDTGHMCWWREMELRLGLGKVIHNAVLNIDRACETKLNVSIVVHVSVS